LVAKDTVTDQSVALILVGRPRRGRYSQRVERVDHLDCQSLLDGSRDPRELVQGSSCHLPDSGYACVHACVRCSALVKHSFLAATLIRPRKLKKATSLTARLHSDEGLTPLSVYWPNAPTPAHWARNKARLNLVDIFSKVIAERRAKDEEHDDVLQVFMEAKYRDGSMCTDEEITGLMIALLFAGQHTSSITSSWTGLHLLSNREFMYVVSQVGVGRLVGWLSSERASQSVVDNASACIVAHLFWRSNSE
jgi:hypothetical protein